MIDSFASRRHRSRRGTARRRNLRLLGAAPNRPILLGAGSETFLVSDEMVKDHRSILGPHTAVYESIRLFRISDIIMDLEMHRPRLVFVWQPMAVNQRFFPRWLDQVRRLFNVCDELGIGAAAEARVPASVGRTGRSDARTALRLPRRRDVLRCE